MGDLKKDFTNQAKDEFIAIISQYMLPLFAAYDEGKVIDNTSVNSNLITLINNANGYKTIRFYPCIGTPINPAPFYYQAETHSVSTQRIPTAILQELMKVAEYGYHDGAITSNRSYGNKSKKRESYKKRTFDLAFEYGMCASLVGDRNAITLHSLLCKMIDWAGKTYEGKKVPFGILIDFDKKVGKASKTVNFLKFLDNNSSAVFTDGVYTGILLDKHGNIVTFLTQDKVLPKKVDKHESFVPFSLYNIAQQCKGNTIGVVVLTNEEILLIKNQEVWFARRGTKWVLFDWNIVHQSLRPYFASSGRIKESTIEKRIKAIYCTLLDVSFSHTGGCLAISVERKYDQRLKEFIRDGFDDYLNGQITKELLEKSKDKLDVLMRLLDDGKSSLKSFFSLEKPLRKEILSLDGATVILLDGEIYCAGSIVSVEGGSTDGGRSAAAKHLAELGIGIKISEDGYIEAYGIDRDSPQVAGNSPNIVTLFKFK